MGCILFMPTHTPLFSFVQLSKHWWSVVLFLVSTWHKAETGIKVRQIYWVSRIFFYCHHQVPVFLFICFHMSLVWTGSWSALEVPQCHLAPWWFGCSCVCLMSYISLWVCFHWHVSTPLQLTAAATCSVFIQKAPLSLFLQFNFFLLAISHMNLKSIRRRNSSPLVTEPISWFQPFSHVLRLTSTL